MGYNQRLSLHNPLATETTTSLCIIMIMRTFGIIIMKLLYCTTMNSYDHLQNIVHSMTVLITFYTCFNYTGRLIIIIIVLDIINAEENGGRE